LRHAEKAASIMINECRAARLTRETRQVKIVDLSRELYHRTPSYPGHPPVMHGVWKNHEDSFAESGNVWGLASMFISMVDHAGTHIDAPRHFGPSGIPINEYPLEKCIVPGICLDLRHIAPRAEITPDDLKAAVAKAGVAVPKGGTVLLCTGHHAKTFPRKEYSTDNSGVNVLATEWLAGQGIVHFGIDSMRPGPDGKVNLLVHKACLDLDITHIESLCNLEALLGQGPFTFIGLPMKMREGTASPIRAVAVFGL
jgi:kynurenine formamidase